MTVQMMKTCSSTSIGLYCGCLRISVRRRPRSSCVLRRFIEVRAELCKCRQLAKLCEVDTQRTGDLLHRLDLCRTADAGNRVADVDSRTHARVEKIGFEKDLSVGDRDHVRRNVSRDVAGLRLDDRQARQANRRRVRPTSLPRVRASVSGDRKRRPDKPRGPADVAEASEISRYAAACFERSS